MYNDWMAEEVKTLTPTGRIQRPAYNVITEWVKAAWEAIDPQLIQRSFKCCGISIAMDKSEESLIFDYNRVEITKLRTGNYVYDDDNNDDDDKSDDDEGGNEGDNKGGNEGNNESGNESDDNFGEGPSSINIDELLEPYIEIEKLEEFDGYYMSQEMSNFTNQWD